MKRLPDSWGLWINLDTHEVWVFFDSHCDRANLPFFGHRINELGCCIAGDYLPGPYRRGTNGMCDVIGNWPESESQVKPGRWLKARIPND